MKKLFFSIMATFVLLACLNVNVDARTLKEACVTATIECSEDAPGEGGYVLICGETVNDIIDEAVEAYEVMCGEPL